MAGTAPGQLNISEDVLIQILCHLDPKDITQVRATCRAFRRAASCRTTWLHALDRICTQHGIFKPTYPTEKMTLAELEHAASGPHRFIKLVKNFPQAAATPLPAQSRFSNFRKKGNDLGIPEEVYSPKSICLVPGGRFLFTGSAHLCLWDLGYSVNAIANPFPLAVVQLPRSLKSVADLEIAPASNGEDILVLVYCRPTGRRRSDNISYQSQGGQWFRLTDPLVVMMSDCDVFVWNWRDREGCRWEMDDDDAGWEFTFHLCGESVIALDVNNEFSIWDIPPRYPVPMSAIDWPIVENERRHCHSLRRNGVETMFLPTIPVWQDHLAHRLCLVADEEEIADGDEIDDDNNVFLYSVRRSEGGDGSCLALSEPIILDAEFPSPWQGSSHPTCCVASDLFYCDGHLVFLAATRKRECIATVLPVPTTSSQIYTMTAASAMLAQGSAFVRSSAGFCPMSGRVVHCLEDSLFRIVDFLLPLSER
ncbi:hypothetical protein NMY22_g13826 [Coprinellus aureogranulatus]|nr:hypothetical protein NMY22_g13826 [Coprinellus aureogranulatus]